MPANHKVSVAWQIVFTFLPIVNFWAFYRIRKLTKYVLYVIAPSIVTSIALFTFGVISALAQPYEPGIYDLYTQNNTSSFAKGVATGELKPILQQELNASYAISAALQGLSIYLVIIWSRQHNRQYDKPTAQPEPSTSK